MIMLVHGVGGLGKCHDGGSPEKSRRMPRRSTDGAVIIETKHSGRTACYRDGVDYDWYTCDDIQQRVLTTIRVCTRGSLCLLKVCDQERMVVCAIHDDPTWMHTIQVGRG